MARDIAEIRRDIEETRERLRDTAEAIGWKADVPARARDVLRETASVVRERVNSGQAARARRSDDGSDDGPSLGERMGSATSSVSDKVGSATSTVTGTVGSAGSAVAGAASAVADKVASAGGAVAQGAGSAAGSATSVGESVGERMPSRGDAREGLRRVGGTARANPMAIAAGALAVGAVAGLLLPSTRVEDERLGPLADDVKGRGAEVAQEAVETGREAVRETVGSAGASDGNGDRTHHA